VTTPARATSDARVRTAARRSEKPKPRSTRVPPPRSPFGVSTPFSDVREIALDHDHRGLKLAALALLALALASGALLNLMARLFREPRS
jgi:hypothetical protein